MPRHFLDFFDVRRADVEKLFAVATECKKKHQAGERTLSMAGRVLGLVFEKPSLRTRVSFQAAFAQLGGNSIYMSGLEAGLGTRETIADFSRVMTSYVDAVVLRTFSHTLVEDYAKFAQCPVINGLSDDAHPCQALADLFTIQEHFGTLAGKRIAFVGDGHNVARSLAVGAALLKVQFDLACPEGYFFPDRFMKALKEQHPSQPLPRQLPLAQALAEADVIYTDVWTSMGQETERDARYKVFAPFQINAGTLKQMKPTAVVMHCLPAHRGEEITDEVMDSPRCIAFTQAANRLHVQKALLLWLLAA